MVKNVDSTRFYSINIGTGNIIRRKIWYLKPSLNHMENVMNLIHLEKQNENEEVTGSKTRNY